MPCEPVTSGVPTRPSSPNSSSSSLSFRMKRVDSGGGGGGARRALTALGANDTKLNLRLAKSLLTISQDKFAKKWNFDPVMEVPLAQGRFSWTPTSSSTSPEVGTLPGFDLSPSCRLLGDLTSSSGSSGPRAAAMSSHDLAAAATTTEAEDNAAALRTCLNLPVGHTASGIIAAQVPVSTGVPCQEPRVPPIHPEEPESYTLTIVSSTRRSSVTETVPACAASGEPTSCDVVTPIHTSSSPCPTTVGLSSDSGVPAGDAIKGPPPSSVDSEVGAEAAQDNQCQIIDPSSTTPMLPPTDNRTHQSTGPQTQTCITNYLHPRKRSSAHLQEVVHPSKAKKVLRAA